MKKGKYIDKTKKHNKIIICGVLAVLISVFILYMFIINESNENNVKSDYIFYLKSNKVPDNYYFVKCDKYNTNYNDLVAIIKEIKMPFRYEKDTFDCSQNAAYVEWFLRNECFNAAISANFSDEHAWVTVYNINGYSNGVIIEASNVNPPIVILEHPSQKYIPEVELNAYGVTRMITNYKVILQGIDSFNRYYKDYMILNTNNWSFVFLNLSRGNYTLALLNHDNIKIKESKSNNNITINENGTNFHGKIDFTTEFQWWNTNLTDKFEVRIK